MQCLCYAVSGRCLSIMVSGHVQMMHSAPSFKPEQDWKQYVVLNCLLWGREVWASLCSSLNRSLRGSWVGLESSKMSDFHVLHNTHFQQKCPWGWTSATFHEKPLENLLWLSREIPNPPDVEARGRTILAKPLLVSGKELGKQGPELLHLWKGIEMKIWGASSKEKQILILFTCEEIHPALPRLRSGLPGTLFEALSEEITCFI